MVINEKVADIESDIARQYERLALYRRLIKVFEGIEFPDKLYVYAYKTYDGVSVEFSPDYRENKDLRSFIHNLAQKLDLTFEKSRDGNDEASLVYKAKTKIGEENFEIRVTGVVPSTCRIEETVEVLSDEEVEESRRKALEDVKLTRTIRKIICD